ncbi:MULTISPECIES: HU family DNA-binding protein [Prevotellaceae]|uniref:HU family DNA-binding protein n=1 Tax=Leyella stercorea TaxID=363265 RepID=UPI001F346738|nr:MULTISPECIES: HU family DNA-binding protein [Prevotellaceae]MCF2578037.1 HU family DNA-binding protein [Leyella stercorea]MCI7183135.1 HU family DNA-binding protein [Prevotella sp.]
MAVNFKIYQSNRKGETNGKYYARATYRETVSIKELAEVMQNNSTVKKSDIVAVLTELSEVIRQELQRGNKVKIDGIGSFKVALRSKGATSAKEFSTSDIIGSRVLFMPETTIDANGNHVKALLAGLKVKEADSYESLKGKEQQTLNEDEAVVVGE